MNAIASTVQSDLMTPAEVAERTNIPVSTIKRWLREGVLPGIKLGYKTWRIHRDEYLRITRGKVGVSPSPDDALTSTNNADAVA